MDGFSGAAVAVWRGLEMEANAIVVLMSAANGEEAARIAEMLVGSHLAACVQIMPEMKSIYRWRGNIERGAEVLMIAKTTAARFGELEREVRALHSYDTPEIIALPITAGSAPYLNWLAANVKSEYRAAAARSSQAKK